MENMKKDRLDELLKCALSGKDDARDAGRMGLQRFRHRLMQSSGKVTVLDALLAKVLAPADAPSPSAIADAGLRSLRESLGRRPVRRWVPALRPALAPALAFATVAVIAALLLIIQPFAKFNPKETPNQTPGGFEGALITRNDIIANLPNALAEPVAEKQPPKAITQDRPKASLHADAMDAFASKVKGESFAKRVTAHRREITASLMNDKDR